MGYSKKIEGRTDGFIVITYDYLLKSLNGYFHVWNSLLKGITLESIGNILYLDIW